MSKKQIVVKVKYSADGLEPGEANTFTFSTQAEVDAFVEGAKAGQLGDCTCDIE